MIAAAQAGEDSARRTKRAAGSVELESGETTVRLMVEPLMPMGSEEDELVEEEEEVSTTAEWDPVVVEPSALPVEESITME